MYSDVTSIGIIETGILGWRSKILRAPIRNYRPGIGIIIVHHRLAFDFCVVFFYNFISFIPIIFFPIYFSIAFWSRYITSFAWKKKYVGTHYYYYLPINIKLVCKMTSYIGHNPWPYYKHWCSDQCIFVPLKSSFCTGTFVF